MKLVYKKWKKKNEKASNSGICKTRYHNGSYLLQFGKIKFETFDNFWNFIGVILLTCKYASYS